MHLYPYMHPIHFIYRSCRGKLTFTDASQSPPLHPVCIYMREEVTDSVFVVVVVVYVLVIVASVY